MSQEVITPERTPKSGKQAFSPLGCFIAAAGATLVTFCLIGAAVVASVWAFSKMIGLPDIVILVLLALSVVPIAMATIWTAGRAWHVEQRLAQGLDIDVPVYHWLYYFRKKA
ncbi:hypothetical protein [Aestuariivirga litoralis]|uniref:hypothetical protein n=1 Tax=Aestuariivirga litoralis TaxID=2650924 RepID=UPI0018C5CCEC|nr:hypothetical protein [Aestuariivirga litoralis]MBG1231968.1 hypothetical protein [Aestuariivirga litoralis]